MSPIVNLLFFVSAGFLFLSSSTADVIGLQDARTFVFSITVVSLAGIVMAASPRFCPRAAALPLSMTGLLTMIAVTDLGGTFNLFDYKILLPILVVLVAPSLAGSLEAFQLVRRFKQLLAGYVGLTAASLLAGGANIARHGHESIVRIDFTGSVVSHSSLCAIYVVLSATALWSGKSRYRFIEAVLLCLSVWMIMLTATRTAVITLAVFGILALYASPSRVRNLRSAMAMTFGAAIVFLAYTVFIDDSFLRRFTANDNASFSSGRLHSIEHWLRLADGAPLGLGIGAVRDHLATGRPELDGEHLLEWPHNEFVRFYVEAGLPGLLLVVLMVAGVSLAVVRAARKTDEPLQRNLMLAIAADMIAQACFQNYFNTVYHSTVLIMIAMVVAAHGQGGEKPKREAHGQTDGRHPQAEYF